MIGLFAKCLIRCCCAMDPDNDGFRVFFSLFRKMKYISVDSNNEIYITMHGLSNFLPAVFQLSLFIVMTKNLPSIQYFWMLKDFIRGKS